MVDVRNRIIQNNPIELLGLFQNNSVDYSFFPHLEIKIQLDYSVEWEMHFYYSTVGILWGKRREAYTFCHHCPSSKLKASKHIYDYNIQNTTYPLKPSYTILLLEVWSVENRCLFSFSSYFDQENLFVMVWKMWKSAFTKLALSRYFWWRIIFFFES